MPIPARIAVVGATGFLGSHLTEHLLAQGHEVLAVARGLRQVNILPENPMLRFEAADIVDRASIHSALRAFHPEVVYHLASEPDAAESADHMQACLESNAQGSVNNLLASIESGARLFVFADSSKVYGNGPVPFRAEQSENAICSYAIAKAAGWRLCSVLATRAQIKIVGLRPTFIYGPRQNFNLLSYVEQAARKGQPIGIQGGSQTRDLLYIEDAVRCFACVMHASPAWGRSLPIGGGFEIKIVDLCRKILDALGCQVDVYEDAHPVRPTEIWRSYCDNSDIGQYAGWAPRISLHEGLRRTFFSPLTYSEPVYRLEGLAV